MIETKSPTGYLLTENSGKFYIRVDGGAVTVIEPQEGVEAGKWPGRTFAEGDTLAFTATTETEAAQVTVGNVKGAALPNTGGAGTRMYTFGGLALMALAAWMYGCGLRRRRERGSAN